MFQTVLNQILIMLILIAAGFICAKTHIINEAGNRVLSNILLMLVNPMLIFTSFQIEKTPEVFHNLVISMVMAAAVMAASIILFTLIFKKDNSSNKNISLFFSIYPNCGFIGIPLVYQILGSEGVICLSGFIAVFNIYVWTHGYLLMSGERNTRQLIKGILSPTMIAIAAGFLCFVLEIRMPSVIFDSMSFISDMNTPLAMLIAGSSLAAANILAILRNKSVYIVSILKLLLMPAIAIVLLRLFPVSRFITYSVLVAAACPSAATGVVFAINFRKDQVYASELFVVTTLFSMATIPLLALLAELTGM